MKLLQKTAPAAEPFDLDAAKDHLRVDIDDDDTFIESLIPAARSRAEQFTQRSFITQSWYLYLDNADRSLTPPLLYDRRPSCNKIKLPRGPIQSVTAFEYLSAVNTWTAIDTSLYYVDIPGDQLVITGCLPTPIQDASGYRITFAAGYGDMPDIEDKQDKNPLPPDLVLGIKTILLHFYENRSAYETSDFKEVPAAGECLLMPYRIMDY